jgi:hypothetical protein
MSLSIQAIQLYRTTKNSPLKSIGIIPDGVPALGDEMDKKSDNAI